MCDPTGARRWLPTAGKRWSDPKTIFYFDIVQDYPSIGGVPEVSSTLFAHLSPRLGDRLVSARAAAARRGLPADGPYIARERQVAAALAADHPDATFFFPNFHSPITRAECGPGARIINVVHDVQFAYLPELFSREALAWLHEAFAHTRDNADEIVFISRTTRDQFIARFGAPRAHRVIYNPVPTAAVLAVRQPAAAPPFLLAVGHSDYHPHKNVAGLVRLFAALAQRDADLELRVAGHGREAFWRAAGALPEALRARVRHLGHVPRAELDRLYAGARAFVSLSRFEGFNIPAAEAASHGTPLILSDLPVHRELHDGRACFVDPLTPDLAAVAAFLDRPRHNVAWPHRAACDPQHVADAYARVILPKAASARRALQHERRPAAIGTRRRPSMAPAMRAALLAGTVLSGAALALTVPDVALADGGVGGNPGGIGGTGFTGQPGGAASFPGGGGGGGAGGGAGGAAGNGSPGGAGGTAGHPDGAPGQNASGGGGGYNGNGVGTSVLDNFSPLSGGNGGTGGDVANFRSTNENGGGGGAGGYGAIVTGTGASANRSSISGGTGGDPGLSGADAGAGGGDGGVGVYFTNTGASFTNSASATITGGNGGGAAHVADAVYYYGDLGGAGGTGVVMQSGTLTNDGAITGGAGGYVSGGRGGTGGAGVSMTGGVLSNIGLIGGGNGGVGGSDPGVGGAGVVGANLTIINSGAGSIAGGTGGNGDSAGAAGGAGIIGSNLSVTNAGTITGGLSGDGATRTNAITFTGGTNSLTLAPGSSISGNVAAFSTADTLALGGTGAATFDLSQIGSQYQTFGIFQKTGTSTWTLTGTTGAVTNWAINQGTLAVASDANLGAPGGSLSFDGGALRFLSPFATSRTITLDAGGGTFDTSGKDGTLAGTVSGGGGLTKTGLGVLTLMSSGYAGPTSIAGGTLRAGATNAFAAGSGFTLGSGTTLDLNGFNQTIGSLAGAGQVKLGSALLTTGGDNTSSAFSGSIGGSGGLTKIGSGTFTLNGTSSYTGPTTVAGGTLVVDGALASTVTVNGGAELMGVGTIGGLDVGAGAMVRPDIGTLTVAGNTAFAKGSTYQVEVTAGGQSDKIIVGGQATLAGGTVQVVADAGTYAPVTRYTILTAAGGVIGTFADATSNFAFLHPVLTYDANDVFLILVQSLSFGSAAQTPNQRAVAATLDGLPLTDPRVIGVLNQTGATAPRALDALSGDTHASIGGALLDESAFFRNALLSRMRQFPGVTETGVVGSLGAGGPALAYAAPEANPVAARFPVKAPGSAASPFGGTVWWTQAIGAWGRVDSDGNAASLHQQLAGGIFGVDTPIGNGWRAGLAGAYTNSHLDVTDRASSASFEGAHLGAYAGGAIDRFNVRTGAALGFDTIATMRDLAFPGLSDHDTAHYGAWTGQVFGEIGYGLAFRGLALEPFAGLTWARRHTDAFAETGGVAALAAASSDQDVGYSSLGLRAATVFEAGHGVRLVPRVSAAWQYAFGNVTPVTTFSFLGAGTPFTIAGLPIARSSAVLEAGADVLLRPNFSLGLSYLGELASSAQQHAVKAKMTWAF